MERKLNTLRCWNPLKRWAEKWSVAQYDFIRLSIRKKQEFRLQTEACWCFTIWGICATLIPATRFSTKQQPENTSNEVLYTRCPLDPALATFSWDVVLRQGKVIALLNEPVADSLRSKFTTTILPGQVQVHTGFLHRGTWFQNGDLIRHEVSGYNEMKAATGILSDIWKNNTFNCAFYHWHDAFIQNLDSTKIDEILAPLELVRWSHRSRQRPQFFRQYQQQQPESGRGLHPHPTHRDDAPSPSETKYQIPAHDRIAVFWRAELWRDCPNWIFHSVPSKHSFSGPRKSCLPFCSNPALRRISIRGSESELNQPVIGKLKKN